MVPLAVIDLLRTPGTSVRVIGSDFFASGPLTALTVSARHRKVGHKQTKALQETDMTDQRLWLLTMHFRIVDSSRICSILAE
jgi:hypothetical protein